jgi:hypothetical protein
MEGDRDGVGWAEQSTAECYEDSDGGRDWNAECEWNGCRNPIQSGFRWICSTMRIRRGREKGNYGGVIDSLFFSFSF